MRVQGFGANASQPVGSQPMCILIFFLLMYAQLSYSLTHHPAEVFHSKGLKELYTYSTEGFTVPIGEMQPLLAWKAQPLHIRLSEESTIPPLQDEKADAVKGGTLN